MSSFIERLRNGTKQFHEIDGEIRRLNGELISLARMGKNGTTEYNQMESVIADLKDIEMGTDESNPCREYKSFDLCNRADDCKWSDIDNDGEYRTTWFRAKDNENIKSVLINKYGEKGVTRENFIKLIKEFGHQCVSEEKKMFDMSKLNRGIEPGGSQGTAMAAGDTGSIGRGGGRFKKKKSKRKSKRSPKKKKSKRSSKKKTKNIDTKIKKGVLKRFENYKKLYKLTNIIYGMKSIDKMSKIMYPNDKISRNKFKKKYNDSNSVYFILNNKTMKAHHLLIKNKDIALDNNIAIDVKKKKYNLKKL